MKICDVIEKYNLSAIQVLNLQSEYLFTCTISNAQRLQKDFIYLPFASGVKEIPYLVSTALKNPFCKGIVINKRWYSDAALQSALQLLVVNFEVFVLTGNIYNLAYAIAEENSKNLSFRTITVAGTEETSTVKELLVQAMGNNGYRVSYPQPDWSFWQKSVEPLLSADVNLDYAIVEVIPRKNHVMDYAAMYYKNNILFTNSKLSNMNVWEEMADLSDELLKLLNYKNRIQSVYTYMDNELINCGISYEFQNRLNFADDNLPSGFEQDFYYLGRCYNLASAFLNNNGIAPVKPSDFKESFLLYEEFNSGKCKYFVINPAKISVNSLKETASLFFKKYPDRQKILIYEHITGLGDYKDEVYRDIFANLAKLNPDVLILLETQKFKHYFKRFNNQTYVKYFPYKSADKTKIDNIKRFLHGIKEDDCAVFVFSEHNLPFIWEEEK